ncbi:MAG TPA: gliding motility-associated C-terminal domain-containing protein [Chryseolinea sp.]
MVKVYQTLIFCVIAFIIHPNSQAQKLYFTDNGAVKRMNLDGSGVQTVLSSAGQYIAVDGNQNLLFHNDGQELYSTKLDGTSPMLITDDGAFAGYNNFAVIPDYEALVLCGITDDMDDLWYGSYYGDPGTPTTRINTGLTMPGDEEYLDVAYNPSEEKIYFTGYDGKVYSAFQDGSGAVQIVGSEAYGPVGVDYLNNKVYWVRYTAGNYYVMSANLNGSSPTTVLSNANNEILSLDVYPEQNAVYFAQYNAIFRMALNGVGGKTSIFTGTSIQNVAVNFDITPPVFFALSPTDGTASFSATGNLTLSFNEQVKKSTAAGTADELSFRIYKATGDVLVETLDRSSGNITISSSGVVTIDPVTILEYNTDYYVLAGNKTISDFTENNWIGITLNTAWNFKTEPDPTVFYSRANGNWNSPATWSHVGHAGPAATTTPGTGTDVIIGNGNTVTFTGNTGVVANTVTGTWIMSGATLDAASFDFTVWGTLRIEGQLLNAGLLTGDFELYATGEIPVFEEIHYGLSALPGTESNIYTHVVALNGIQSINGGTINTNGFQICVPPTPPPTDPLFSGITPTSITLSWTGGGGQAFVIAREGSTSFQPEFGQAYTANAAFGTGASVGTGNFLVYSGSGTSVTVTGLTPDTYYEFDLYSFSTSIGGCYSVQNYQFASSTSCVIVPPPSGAVNAQYCAGETKPALVVNSPGVGNAIIWYDAPTGGNIVNGDVTGGDGLGEVFIPTAPSGTFYAETYDAASQCYSATRTPVTLTLHPPLAIAAPSINQSVCNGGDPAAIDGGVASGGTGTYTYQWESASAAAGPYLPIGSATDATYDPPSGFAQTTYFRRITRSSSCLQTGSPIVITLGAAPNITAQPVSPQVCDGQSTSFSVTATGGSLGYQWQADAGTGYSNISNGGVYSGANSNQLQISNVAGLNNVRYQCVVTSGGACPVTSNAVPLLVNARPVATNQTQAVCEGVPGSGIATVNLTTLNPAVTSGVVGLTVSWFTNAALTTAVPTPSAATATNNIIFYARVNNTSTGCNSTATATYTVNSKPSGTGTVAGPLSLCTGSEGTYTISGIVNAQRYNWQVTAGLEIVSQTGTTANIRGASGASGSITVTPENGCGAGTTSAALTVQILPAPDIRINAPAEIVVNEPAQFSYESASGNPASVLWNFGDNGTSSEESPTHVYSTEGNYDVTLTVTADNACETTASTAITVLPLEDLDESAIKNVITANGDDQNGFLYIESIEKYPSNQVVLLDRWGVEVFKKDNYLNDWDARKNGEYLPPGQYVCVVKFNDTGKILTRTVSIIKR